MLLVLTIRHVSTTAVTSVVQEQRQTNLLSHSHAPEDERLNPLGFRHDNHMGRHRQNEFITSGVPLQSILDGTANSV